MKKVIAVLLAILFVFLFFAGELVAQDRSFSVYTVCRFLQNPQAGVYAVKMGWQSNQDFAIQSSAFEVLSAWPANPIYNSWDLIGYHPETQMYAGKEEGSFAIILWDGRGFPDSSRHVIWTIMDYEGNSSSADASYDVPICKPPATPTPRPTTVPVYPTEPPVVSTPEPVVVSTGKTCVVKYLK